MSVQSLITIGSIGLSAEILCNSSELIKEEQQRVAVGPGNAQGLSDACTQKNSRGHGHRICSNGTAASQRTKISSDSERLFTTAVSTVLCVRNA